MTPESEPRKVLMSTNLFDHIVTRNEHGDRLRVEWGEPDKDGFYTPTVYTDTTDNVADDARAEADRLRAGMQSLLLLPAKYDLNAYARLRLAVEEHVEVGCITGHTGQRLVDALAATPSVSEPAR